jgi:hypothetical protein
MLEEIGRVPETRELSERFRLIFLICRKHNVERTIQTIQSFLVRICDNFCQAYLY